MLSHRYRLADRSQPSVPAPDDIGIYQFPSDLNTAHDAWIERLRERSYHEPQMKLLEIDSPFSHASYLIQQPQPHGRPVVVIEPHHDDFALSAAGAFLVTPRPLTIVTVFSECASAASVRRDIRSTYRDAASAAQLRHAESAVVAQVFEAVHVSLGFKDAVPPYEARRGALAIEITDRLLALVKCYPDAELIAPAAVTRHPDHVLTYHVAGRLGCTWWWEDVAFWPTYALAVDDQQLFRLRVADKLQAELVDITPVVLDKLTLLRVFESQMLPAEMWRPIRYAWTVGQDLPPDHVNLALPRFAERYYRTKGAAR